MFEICEIVSVLVSNAYIICDYIIKHLPKSRKI